MNTHKDKKSYVVILMNDRLNDAPDKYYVQIISSNLNVTHSDGLMWFSYECNLSKAFSILNEKQAHFSKVLGTAVGKKTKVLE